MTNYELFAKLAEGWALFYVGGAFAAVGLTTHVPMRAPTRTMVMVFWLPLVVVWMVGANAMKDE